MSLLRHHFITCFAITAFAVMMGMLASCRHGQNDANAMKQLDDSCLQAVIASNFHVGDSLATILLDKANKADDDRYRGKALFYLGCYDFVKNDCRTRLPKLQKALVYADKVHDDTLQCRIYNMLGIHEMAYYRRYDRAQQYLSKAVKLGEQLNNKPLQMAAESNLSEVYRVLQDTIGIRYDREILDYAQKTGNKVLQRASAYHCAYYYVQRAKSINELKPYIDAMATSPGDSSLIDIVYAEFYLRQGDLHLAEEHAKKAIKSNDVYDNILIVYARILNKEGRYDESNKVLQDAERKYSAEQLDYKWIDLYSLYADNYHALGNDSKAYGYMKRYDELRDSATARIHEEQININRVKYEVDKKNQEIERQRLINRQQLTVGSAVIILLLIIFIAYYLYMRRYHRFARNIVRQHKQAMANENLLRQRIGKSSTKVKTDGVKADLAKTDGTRTDETKADGTKSDETKTDAARTDAARADGVRTMSDEKLDEIFEKIRVEMEDNEIYRDATVTRDMFSERVGCNHTYLTYAIKTKTGMSYSQFMNSYRIRKAIEILTDSNQTMPLKELSKSLGFIAVSTFYSVFQQQVGLSPAAYRRTAKEMSEVRN